MIMTKKVNKAASPNQQDNDRHHKHGKEQSKRNNDDYDIQTMMIITNRVNKVIGTMMNMKKSTKLLPRTNKTMIIITNKVRNNIIGTMMIMTNKQ